MYISNKQMVTRARSEDKESHITETPITQGFRYLFRISLN